MDLLRTYAALGADVAAILGILAAFIAVLTGVFQLRANVRLSREARAMALFSDHLRTSMQYPGFAAPDLKQFTSEESESYAWYVASLLNTFEEIDLVTREPIWRAVFRYTLARHVEFFASERFGSRERALYAPELVRLIDELIVSQAPLAR